jgi:hypothetical protein
VTVTDTAESQVLRAADLLRDVAVKHGIRLSLLVAETSLWASPEVHRRLAMEATGGAYFPDRRRCRLGQGESPGQKLGTLVLDNNSYANVAIKRALGVEPHQVVGFEACHIWPRTCYDERYHTLIANLVLVPRALAGVTDHDPAVEAVLQYRAFELYGWHPAEAPAPQRPSDYPDEWRPPMPFSNAVARALAKRTLRRLPETETVASSDAVARSGASPRDYTRYNVHVGARSYAALPKRIAVLTVIRGLVASGASPSEIAASLPALGSRLFRSADGELSSADFVSAVSTLRAAHGKSFDATRYFCADEELIHHGGRTYALSSQWGGWTQDSIDTLLRVFPNHGVSVTPQTGGAVSP